ncbi:MAG: hypothetical protein ACTSYM_10330 [Candidatus Baldrarchaeia archaeon]
MKPYYFRIKDPMEFLRYYLRLYEEDYGRTKAWKISRLIPVSMKGKKVLDVACEGLLFLSCM